MKSKNIKKILIISIPVVLILIITLCFFTSPAYKTAKAIKNNDCQQAIQCYSNVEGAIQTKLFDMLLPNSLDSVNEQYNCGDLSLEDIEKIYHTVIDFESTVDISARQVVFEELKNSKESYKIAKDAMNSRDYATAITNYEKVSAKDSLYEAAQTELQNAKNNYKSIFDDEFYDCILKNDIKGATALLNDAFSIIPDADLEAKKDNLSSGVYSQALELLNTTDEWETIEQAHGGPNEYCCYKIQLAQGYDNIFRCYYVGLAANSLVQSGHVNSISGPVAWYRIDNGQISDLSYDEEKRLEESSSVSWDYTMSEKEKLKKLESLLFE